MKKLLSVLSLTTALLTPNVYALKTMKTSSYMVAPEVVQHNHETFIEESSEYEYYLRNMQLVLIVDRSGSQKSGDEHPQNLSTSGGGMLGSNWTQWDNTYLAAKYLAEELFMYDKDGEIPIYFFDSEVKGVVAHDPGEMLELFQKYPPRGTTNLYDALKKAFSEHKASKRGTENILYIVLTDGAPNKGQKPKIKKLINEKLTKVDKKGDRYNVLFIRIGDNSGAINFLRELDDDRTIGDNVDTKSDNMIYRMGPKSLILNAVFEHLDQKYKE